MSLFDKYIIWLWLVIIACVYVAYAARAPIFLALPVLFGWVVFHVLKVIDDIDRHL